MAQLEPQMIEFLGMKITCIPCRMEDAQVNVAPPGDIFKFLERANHVDVSLKPTAPGPNFYEGPVTFNMVDGRSITVQGTVRKEQTSEGREDAPAAV